MIRSIIILWSLGSVAGLAMETKPLTLKDCLDEALQRNPAILTAQQTIAQTGGALLTARSVFLPQVTSSLQTQWENQDVLNQQAPPHLGFQDDWIITLQTTQTVYSGGINQNRLGVARLQDQVATVQLQEAINTIVFNTRKAFYDLLLSQSDIKVRQQTVDLLKREVSRQKSLFEAGRSTKFDILRTEVRLANELPGLEQAQVTSQAALFTLLNVLGRPYPGADKVEALTVEGSLGVPNYPRDGGKLIALALSRSPELSREQKQIEIEKLNAKIARASIIPQFSFFAADRVRQDAGQGSGFLENRNQATVGILGNWNIFDGLAGKGNALQAEANARSNTITRDASARRIEYDVRLALLSLKQAEASLQSQEGNVQKAQQSIDLARSSVEAGLSTQFDVLQATVDLSSAENIELQARYTYNVALATLEKVTYTRLPDAENDANAGKSSPLWNRTMGANNLHSNAEVALRN